MSLADPRHIVQKWTSLLEHKDYAPISDPIRRQATAIMLENAMHASRTDPTAANMTETFGNAETLAEAVNVSGTGGYSSAAAAGGPVAGYDPILMSMVRRTTPNLIAYDLVGVQPMTAPVSQVFAYRVKYDGQAGTEAYYNEANTAFSGEGAHTGALPTATSTGKGLDTGEGELLGTGGANPEIASMGYSLEKVVVEAKTRALKAEYTIENAQDLKNVHGLDAETEIISMLTTQILAEINREVIRKVYFSAMPGSQATAVPGTFDLDADANGRWSVEKYKGLMIQIDFEANAVGKASRAGKGNIILCSSDVASALSMAGILDYAPAIQNSANFDVDDNGNTFAGILQGRYKVFIDPYAVGNYFVVGYKGKLASDAGIFYCPYIPLQMVRAVNSNSFIPAVGFRTRYGLVANPFSNGATRSDGSITANSNVYYRKSLVANLL